MPYSTDAGSIPPNLPFPVSRLLSSNNSEREKEKRKTDMVLYCISDPNCAVCLRNPVEAGGEAEGEAALVKRELSRFTLSLL